VSVLNLDDLWHFITSGQFTAETVLQRFKSARLIPTQMVQEILNGKRPEYLSDLVDFIAEQRKKVTEGGMTRSHVARAYAITAASQGADAIKADTFARKLQEANIKLDVPDEYFSHNRKGELTIRPEEAMAVWLQGPTGQKALADLEAGKYNEAAWRESAKIRAAFGDDRLTKLNVFGKAQLGYFNMRNLHELVDALNAAQGDSRKIGALVSPANGIASGKTGFIKHLLGFGDTPTIDAQEINFWLTGRGDIGRREGRQVELARAVKGFTGNPR
jgi:hypothetical protein